MRGYAPRLLSCVTRLFDATTVADASRTATKAHHFIIVPYTQFSERM